MLKNPSGLRRPRTATALLLGIGLALLAIRPASADGPPPEALLPDPQTVVPLHLQVVNAHQREVIRFSNGIANTGAGPLQLRPEFPLVEGGTQDAIQELLDADGNVVFSLVVSQFEFHPDHNHFHIAAVAGYEIRAGAANGPVIAEAQKVTFCMIDWYALEGNSKTPDRVYGDCSGETQGISPGWADQYHHATPGQELDITGVAPGLYYLVSTSNPEGNFIESDLTNNTAWTSFQLRRDSKGNAKITIVATSPCSSPALCGEKAPNR